MIHVYDKGNSAYDKNGNVILFPKSGTVRMAAGGNYELQMVCPMDAEGGYRHLIREAVVKAPVPKETIETAYSGMDVDVYVTTGAAALRSGKNEPSIINYSAWTAQPDPVYTAGSKVTYLNANYQCTQYNAEDYLSTVPPGPNHPWWVEIARTTAGDPVLVNLKSGTDLYYVSGPDGNGWYTMCTTYGLEGYIKGTQITFSRHLTPAETQPRTITEQLFRIKTVNRDRNNKTVTVNAKHISYDLNGVLIKSAKINRKPPAEALAWIEQGFMISYPGTIATNMPTSADATYSAEISGKSGMYALIDPDKGVVPCFGAEFRRDNWDLFVMAKTNTDRGFRIRYSNNMQGVQWKTDSSSLKTRIVPVAKDADGSDLYLTPYEWVDSSHINDYDTIYMERLKVNGQVGKDDGTETATNWTAATLRTEMAKQAQSLFDVNHVDVPSDEITVAFEMLGDTAEYPRLKDLQSMVLYDTVIAIDEDTGLSASVTVDELEFDIVKKKITAAKLTNYKAYNVKNVGGFNVLDNSITGDKLTDEAGDQLIGSAVDRAAEEAADYTDMKANQTRQQAAEDTEDAIGTYDTAIKAWIAENYQPLPNRRITEEEESR